MVERQMGQSVLVSVGGGGTVRMGRRDVDEIGGDEVALLGAELVPAAGAAEAEVFSLLLASEDPFVSVSKVTPDFSLPALVGAAARVGAGTPDTVGGGNSMPSAAFRESCLAKSLACHHSRNLSAKMDVGSRILRLASRRGYTA